METIRTRRRGQQNHHYAENAFVALSIAWDEGNEWVFPLLEHPSPSVLSELGRVEDPELFWQCVRHLTENELPAKKAIAAIRRARLGEPPDVLPRIRLHNALIKTIEEHRARYPDTTNKDILEALYVTSKAVGEPEE